MEHGNEVLRVLKEKYEREMLPEFADIASTEVGDILFVTGNGANSQPEIMRVLESPWIVERTGRVTTSFIVARIYPNNCPACHDECRHGSVMPEGSLLKTRIAHG